MKNPITNWFGRKNKLQRVQSAPGKMVSTPTCEEDSLVYPLRRTTSYVKVLSAELLLHILRYLSARELCVMASVSASFRSCALDKSLWRSVSLHTGLDRSKLVGAIQMMSKLDLFTAIRILSINNDNINPTMVEQIIQSSPNLREIKFNNVKVTEKMAKLLVSCCPTLEQVYMEGGRTDDECLELLSNGAIKLKSINLHKVQNITTTGICHVIKNTNLAFLNFNGISGWDIRSLAPYCSHFTSMDLGSSNNLIDTDLKSLTKNCKKLVFLSLKSCKMITDESMRELIEDCPQLTELNMSGCSKLSSESVKLALQNFHQLSTLKLASMNLTPIPYPRFPYRVMTSMHTLDLSHSDVKDEDLRHLVEFCPNLRVLKLVSCTNLTDAGVTYLAQHNERIAVLDVSRDSTLVSLRMSITLAAIAEFAKREHTYKVYVSYSARNQLTTRTLNELNTLRTTSGMKPMIFHLIDSVAPSAEEEKKK
eukprot:Phypoly_transcript_08126.p1 GENE.Phypoly_transcript_08126~~Phypoly_transcript_08126.p1  ORF type:complete len:502 (-),score=85.25 Phypoly_transcript_08126:45-1481(-)